MKTVLEMNKKYLSNLIEYYKLYEDKPTSAHIKHLFKSDDFTITVYHTNKVLFQGSKGIEEYQEWAKILGVEPKVLKPIPNTAYMNEYYDLTVIGSDEVGTGDFFGPVVVTAAMVGKDDYPFLKEYNIQDSKNISDRIITEIAPKLMKQIPYHTLVLNNKKFNKLTKEGYNMNKIKAYLHNHAIKKMMTKNDQYQTIIIDAFCSRDNYFKYLKDQQVVTQVKLIEKAESVHLSVAVAAIIARYRFLQEMNDLSRSIDITLPKGAGPSVDAIAKLIHLKEGDDIFNDIAKINFKNFKKLRD